MGVELVTDDQNEAAVLYERARGIRDRGVAITDERHALQARLEAYQAEVIALEARGTVPRGIRRRGERLRAEADAYALRELFWEVEREAIEAEVEAYHEAHPDSDGGPLGDEDPPA